MKRIAASLLLSLVAAVATTAAQSPADLSLAKLAVTAHSTGNLLLEQILLRRLMLESSGNFADAARHRLAENALERGDYAETIRLLNSGDGSPERYPNQSRYDRVVLARAMAGLGEVGRANEILHSILRPPLDRPTSPSGYVNDEPDEADLESAKLLDTIGGDINENEHFSRASIYQFNRYWDEARQHYRFVKTTPDAAEARFQIGRGYSQSAEYGKAIPYYQSVIDSYPNTPQAKDALLQLAGAYSRIDSSGQAISLYQNFIAKYPADDKLDRAYLNIVDIYRDLGDDAHALEWCQKTEAAFTSKTPETLAIFDEAKIYASRSEWQNEIASLDRLKGRNDRGGAAQPGGTTLGEIAFMRGYALEQLGRWDEARNAYMYCGVTESFYCQWAFTRIDRLTSEWQQVALPKLELPQPPPAEYAEIVDRRATAKDIFPGLMIDIMRQESKFDPQARSSAGARGLMQFTHPQGLKIAKELGWTYFEDDELYSPENSIALAAQYLADLNAMFPNQTEAVVASYNGGEGNVKRWMARARSNDPERYVPELVFGQTKDYVAKVMANYRVYQQLYDEQLRPK